MGYLLFAIYIGPHLHLFSLSETERALRNRAGKRCFPVAWNKEWKKPDFFLISSFLLWEDPVSASLGWKMWKKEMVVPFFFSLQFHIREILTLDMETLLGKITFDNAM